MDIKIPNEITVLNKKILYRKDYKEKFDVLIAHNDVLEFLKNVPSESIKLVITSPPYNIGKPYEHSLEFKDYLEWQKQVVEECVRILQPNGSICWEIGNFVKDGEVFPLDVYFYDIMKKLNLKLRNRIVWHFEHGLHASKRFSGRYETILWFTKGDKYTFNLDSVRVPQKYPGKRAYKGPKKGLPTSNPLGKNPSDIWQIVLNDWEKEIWDIPNVKSNHPEKTIHPCQFPIELVERIVLALTNKDDYVFDPFLGVGSTLIASVLNNRISFGVDKEKKYTDLAFQRVQDAIKGKLKTRKITDRIFIPKGTEKVSKIPTEWKLKLLKDIIKYESCRNL